MSNQLHFPVRIYERSVDDLVIMVPHENAVWVVKKTHTERTDQTRDFCAWIRKQFKDLPTEYRYVNKKQIRINRGRSMFARRYKTVNCDKHFVAYGLTRSQLLLIKLSWIFTTQPVFLTGNPSIDGGFQVGGNLEPTPVLEQRMAKPEQELT